MEFQIFYLDDLYPEVRTWLSLIEQARKNPEGQLVPSFLEIIQQIVSNLDEFFKKRVKLREMKTIFLGISIISYLNEKYAIEKVMMFAKGRCYTSVPPPSEFVTRYSEKFAKHLTHSSLDIWESEMGKSLVFFLKKDFQAARATLLPLNPIFKQKLKSLNLSLLEAVFYSLLKNAIIPILIKNLNNYQEQYAQDPLSIYFSILNNLIYEIKTTHNHRTSSLQRLITFLNNLSQLE